MKALFLAAIAIAAPAIAQTPKPIYITMTDDGFAPRQIALQAGVPYVLYVTNRSDKGHNLTQEAFFRDARIARADRPITGDGKIVLDAHRRAVVHFIAPTSRPGATYQFSSTVLADASKDYKGAFRIR